MRLLVLVLVFSVAGLQNLSACSIRILRLNPDGYRWPVAYVRGFVHQSELIVRAVAVGPVVLPPIRPGANEREGVRFRVEEVLQGQVPDSGISFTGVLVDEDDFQTDSVPYQLARPAGRRGSCFAREYRVGAEYLLLLRQNRVGLTPYWAGLAPLNEQIRGPDDPWVEWVRGQIGYDAAGRDTTYLLEPGRAGPFDLGMTAGELFDLTDRLKAYLVASRYGDLIAFDIHLDRRESASLLAPIKRLVCVGRTDSHYVPQIEIRDRRFRTREGVGVGSTFSEVLHAGWIDERGLPAARALHPEQPDLALVRFVFALGDETFEDRKPPDDPRVTAVHLSAHPSTLTASVCQRRGR